MSSLRRVAFLWISALLLMAGLAGAAAAYFTATDETSELLDQQLRQIARYVGDDPPPAAPPPHDDDYDPEDDFVVQVWDGSGNILRSSDQKLAIPRQGSRGFSTVEFGAEAWRVFTDVSALRTVQISQRVAVREELAASAALRTAAPIAILLPLSWFVLGFIVDQMMRRLDRVTQTVTSRNEHVRSRISLVGVPIEIAPLVEAVNDLVARLHNVVDRQKRFVSDAAHELRTPLTALSLQAENIRGAIGHQEIDERVNDVEAGIRRARIVVDQLLRLARLESGSGSGVIETVEVDGIVAECVALAAPIALARTLRLAVACKHPVRVTAAPSDIKVLISNLLDNAMKYTPPGGRIDIRLERPVDMPPHPALPHDPASVQACDILTISDSGPGIAPDLLNRAFERFFRASSQEIEGAGLGLAICKSIADRYGIDIMLENRTEAPGLRVSLRFPQRDLTNV